MSVSLNMNGVNQLSKGNVIYQKDEPLSSICLVLKGRVLVQADGVKTVFSSGNFLGACDIEFGAHSFTYTAYDDVVLYAFFVSSREDFQNILDKKPEYRGLLNTSTNYFIGELSRTLTKLEDECKSLREFVLAQYDFYQKTGTASGVLVDNISSVDILRKRKVGDISLCKEIDYYLACTKLPVVAQKNYYMGSKYISDVHYKQQIDCVFSLMVGCRTYADQLRRCFGILVGDEKNLFSSFSRMAMDMAHVGADNKSALLAVDELLAKINQAETYLTEKAGLDIHLDRERMESTYYSLISGEKYEKKIEVTETKVLHDLDNSLSQILDYATLEQEDKDEFEAAVKEFCRLSDKESKTDDANQVRKAVVASYYRIYENVLRKSFEDKRPPIVIQLFLRFGFVSENLLKEEQIATLMELHERKELKGGCKVYTMDLWLRSIYKMEKQPSKNEFDMNYDEFLKHEKNTGFLDEHEYEARKKDPAERLHFEITNLFQYANRLVHGKLTTFVPLLYGEGIMTDIEKSFLTSDRINSMLNKIQNTDYSIFFRERRVAYEKVGINKETIVKRCLPDIILFPVYGLNGVMWQDIVGKRRDTSGRFLFPIILESNLEKEMLKVLAHFRWEICRSEQGMQWNNLHYPSLTSEYTDYLQFYRRNSDLSPEARTKVKSQLTQASNRHREVFTKDYADWITRESKGAMKVNRVARTILSTYVPFSGKIREKLKEQTIYADASKKFRIEQAKRIKEIENSCTRFSRAGLDIPPELQITREFYHI